MLRASQRGSADGRTCARVALRCPQHEGKREPCILAKRTQRVLLRSSPRKRGPITTVFGYGSRLSARFAGVGRDDDPVGFVKNQPAGVGHDRRPRSIAQGLLFTMENATRACEP